jgi:nucleoside-diphosphate-sugar epimerase
MEVVCLDRVSYPHPDLRTIIIDLEDTGQVFQAVAGCDAILHLGAIPSPTVHPADVVFRNNVMGEFNVFEAAAVLGIRRVVHASSVSALGFPYQHRWSTPLYVPVEEEHPLIPQDAYGLSKTVGEEVGAAYCRRGAGSAAGLRFSTILAEEAYADFIAGQLRDPGLGANVLWSYTDLRDAARSCALALTAPFTGYHPLYITANDTTSDVPTNTLLERYFPEVPRRPVPAYGELSGAHWSVVDCSRASRLLDFQPEYTWRQVLAARSNHAEGESERSSAS